MEDLLARMANMLIQSCRNHILGVDGSDLRGNLWKKSPVKLCDAFQECIRLRVAFEDHYRYLHCLACVCVLCLVLLDSVF
jgi:hypothetical protein